MKRIAGIGVLILLVILLAGCGTPAAKTTAPAKAQPVAASGSSILGHLTTKVVSWNQSQGDSSNTPKAGDTFIVVDAEIANSATVPYPDLSTDLQMSLRDAAGHKWEQAMYFPDPAFPDGTAIPAGGKSRGLVAFEVPVPLPAGLAFDFAEPGGDMTVPLR